VHNGTALAVHGLKATLQPEVKCLRTKAPGLQDKAPLFRQAGSSLSMHTHCAVIISSLEAFPVMKILCFPCGIPCHMFHDPSYHLLKALHGEAL
jgi:hypothetical protein